VLPLDSLPGLVIPPPDEGGGRRRRLLQQHAKNPLLEAILLQNPTVLVSAPKAGSGPLKAAVRSASEAPITITDHGLTAVLEHGSPPVSFACDRTGMVVSVVAAELGSGLIKDDVTVVVSSTCRGNSSTCVLNAFELSTAVGWTSDERALQVKLACVCGAGYANLAAASSAGSSDGTTSVCQPCQRGQYRGDGMGSCSLWCAWH
jgi:hypothetical protein